MTNVERRENVEQSRARLLAQERKALASAKSPETRKAVQDSINIANRIEVERRKQVENTKKLQELRRLDGLANDLQNPKKIINAINALKKQNASVSFYAFMKRGVLDKNYKLLGFKWTKTDRSEFSISYKDSLGNSHQKRLATPKSGSVDMVKVFNWVYQDIQSVESKIYSNRANEAIMKSIENFDTKTLSSKIQAYLKAQGYISTFGNTLDFKKGVGNGIQIDKGMLKLGNVVQIAIKNVYKNGILDQKAFISRLSQALDQKANTYFLSDITTTLNNLGKSKFSITDASYKHSLIQIESKIQQAQKLGIKIPENQINVVKEKREKIKNEENFQKEDMRLTNMYKTYYDLLENGTGFDLISNIKMIRTISARLTNGTLAGFEGKSRSSKSYFDAVGKSQKYQEHVKKFQVLVKKVEF